MGDSFSNGKYIALIGDIINSRDMDDRLHIQNKLACILDRISCDFEEDIASEFMITLGDEFQGLLKKPANIINILWAIEREMYPVKLRFGIGIGTVDTNIIRETPFGMDGPAYHNAREMLQKIKSLKKKRMTAKTDIMIKISDYEEYSMLINTIFSLTYNLRNKWTEPQRDAISAYINCDRNQEEAAITLGITQSGINKRLNSANFYTYAEAVENIEKSLNSLWWEN